MRLMIVDDHPGVRLMIRQLVATAEDAVCECGSGEEAARRAPEFKPDFVTMDVRMPGLCGIEATRLVRMAYPPARVAVVTSVDQPELRRAASDAGAWAFLPKENLSDLLVLLTGSTASASGPAAPDDTGALSSGAQIIQCSSADDASVPGVNQPAPRSARQGPVLLILMIEDAEQDCELVRNELARGGYAPVVHRVSDESGLRRSLGDARWDLIFTDHNLPGFSGLAALDVIRQMQVEVPILCVTGSVDAPAITPLLRAGAREWVSKDDLGQLCPAVQRALAPKVPVTGIGTPEAHEAAHRPAPPTHSGDSPKERLPAAPTEKGASADALRIAQLERQVAELESFGAAIAHDLRAPLRAIGNSVSFLQEQGARHHLTGADDHLARIHALCRTMNDRIERLLALGQSHQYTLKTERLEPRLLVLEAIDEVCPDGQRERLDVRIDPLTQVLADRVLLRLVFVNLLANALKYSARRENPRIEVGSRCQDGEVIFFVRDNGAGFDLRYAAGLFQPFQRMHSAREFEGTGLGLASVRRIIQRHGGRIWAEAEVDRGATFFFTLPAAL